MRASVGLYFVCFVWIGGMAAQAEGATLEIAYRSLERIIVNRLMTEGGRYYMEGDPSSVCSYAFVQEPRVAAEGGRLQITVLFAGRAGREIAGRCVGAGDNFDLLISGVPSFAGGELYLSELSIEAPDTAYFKLVEPLIRRSLEGNLRYPVVRQVERGAAALSASGNGTLTVEAFQVDSITVGEGSLSLSYDLELSLRPRP